MAAASSGVPSFNFTEHNYSFELSDKGKLTISETSKPRKPKFDETITSLSSLIIGMQTKEQKLSDTKQLDHFIDKFSEKVELKIRNEHWFWGGLIVWWQKNVGGALKDLSALKRDLATLKAHVRGTAAKNAIQVVFRSFAECQPVDPTHKALKDHLKDEIPDTGTFKEKLKEKIAADGGQNWLEGALRLPLADESVKLLLSIVQEMQSRVLGNIIARYAQITSAKKFEKDTLVQALRMAFEESKPVGSSHAELVKQLGGVIPNEGTFKAELRKKIASAEGPRWLEATLKHNLHNESVQLLLSIIKENKPPVFQDEVARYEKIQRAKPHLPLREALRMAFEECKPVDPGHKVLKERLGGVIPNVGTFKEKLKERIAAADGLKWLKETLELPLHQALPDASVVWLVSVLKEIDVPLAVKDKDVAGRIVARFAQITAAEDFEENPLPFREALHMAIFIEAHIRPVTRAAEEVFAKGKEAPAVPAFYEKGTEGITRAIQVDWSKRDVYVIADLDQSKLNVRGAYKVGVNAMRLFKDFKTPEMAVQLSTTADRAELAKMSHDELTTKVTEINVEQFPALAAELEFFTKKEYKGKGVAELYTAADYTEIMSVAPKSAGRGKGGKAKEPERVEVQIPRKSMIFKRASGGDLSKIIRDKIDVPLQTQAHMATQLASFFALMHENDDIHGDIKGENILLYGDGRVGVTDFGMAFNVNSKEKTPGRKEYDAGSYGTVKNSAPELFNVNQFNEDVPKTESWALGCVLYGVLHKDPPPWDRMLHAFRHVCYGTKEEVLQMQNEMKNWPIDQREKVEELMGDYIKRRARGGALSEKQVDELAVKVKENFIEKVEERVEARWKDLNKEKSLSPDKQYELAVLGLLRLNPKDRLSMTQFVERARALPQPAAKA